ncbi:trypsin-like serine peptidase [Streptosporangium sp. CA-115845]|uniref:trypsin-like serine peptidase n=1 Tax=Streptosporangium sp. CA-115845 TaxID=3240071 RepID=UPI003D8FFEE0
MSLPALPAQAGTGPVTVSLTSGTTQAQQVANFWLGDSRKNLLQATPYGVQTVISGRRQTTAAKTPAAEPTAVEPMGRARRAAGLSENVNLPTTTGKVFFVGADGRPHWCSGTSLNSAQRNLVLTAAHCVYDTAGDATTLANWAFVPGYTDDALPWGLYVGKSAVAHHAFAVVYNGVSQPPTGGLADTGRLGDNVGGQGIAWNQQPGRTVNIFGYPAGSHPDNTAPYTGKTLENSQGLTFPFQPIDFYADNLVGATSPFTDKGSLGSPWLMSYRPDRGLGYIIGVTMSVSDIDLDNRYDTAVSATFDGDVSSVYSSATQLWSGSIAG